MIFNNILFNIQFFGGSGASLKRKGGTSSGVSKRKGGTESGSKTSQKTSEKSVVYHLRNNDREIPNEERNNIFREIIQRATAGTIIKSISSSGRLYDRTYEVFSTSTGKLRMRRTDGDTIDTGGRRKPRYVNFDAGTITPVLAWSQSLNVEYK